MDSSQRLSERLKALGVKPRRTVRVALWSGEEQGLLGSQAYVKQHFGSFENPKPGYEKFGGYFNIDSGTGRVRGASVFGPPQAAEIMRGILAPFKEDGVLGANPSRGRNLGGSDNTSFSNAGLPGIGMGQDPIEYNSHTWHTNLDTYERILEDDVKKDAMVVADGLQLDQAVTIDGIYAEHVPKAASMQVVAALPDGDVQPLVWLYQYQDRYQHPFLFRKPLTLPRGTLICGVRSDAKLFLIPAARTSR